MILLSRVAESLYWLGRYLERAEGTARLLSVTYYGRFESGPPDVVGASNTWEAMLTTLGQAEAFRERFPAITDRAVIRFLTLETDNPFSIVACLAAARETARSVRDFLSSESWIAINRAYRDATTPAETAVTGDGFWDYCDSIMTAAHSIRGTMEATSLHDEGWWWYIGGLALERGDIGTRIVDAKYHLLLRSAEEVGGPEDRFQWAGLLRSVSGWEAFRRLHPEGITPLAVTEFLVLDPRFPRSLRASVDSLSVALDRATADAQPALRDPAMRAVTQVQQRLQYKTAASLIAAGLHEAMGALQLDLIAIDGVVGRQFFGWADAAV